MTDQEFQELKHWIATSHSDHAQAIRAALAPMMADLIERARAFDLIQVREMNMRKKMRRYAQRLR